MTIGNPDSRPLVLGAPGSPDEITAGNLHCIPIDWNDERNRPWLASEVSDDAFHVWITRLFPAYVTDRENQVWPVERRVEICNRLWQAREVWGVTYIEPAQEYIPATSIQLMPAEGPHAGIVSTFTAWNADEQLYSHSDTPDALPEHVTASSIWEAASQMLSAWANESKPIEGYYKIDYAVHYQNGQVFKNLYLLTDQDADRADLGADMRSTCAMYSGRQLPAELAPEDETEWRRRYVTPEYIAHFGALLDHYEIGKISLTQGKSTAPTLPRTKQEAYRLLRQLAPAGSIIQVDEPHIIGERDRLLSFAVVCSNERLQDINALASRIFDMPLEEVPERPGMYAVRARDTGKHPGGSFVATLSFKLYRRPDAFRYRSGTSNQPV